MSTVVIMTAQAQCTMGQAPAPVRVTSQQKVLAENKPVATIQDGQGPTNVGPFGMCTSMANPQVASATAAAMGVLTPMPCVPQTTGMWIPTKPTLLIDGKPCLTNDCKLICAYAGNISITMAGQVKVSAS